MLIPGIFLIPCISVNCVISEFLSENDVYESLKQNGKVVPEGAMLKIIEVEFESSQHLFEGVGIAVI